MVWQPEWKTPVARRLALGAGLAFLGADEAMSSSQGDFDLGLDFEDEEEMGK